MSSVAADEQCTFVGYTGDLYVAQVVFSVAFATSMAYCLVLLALFVWKRKKQPLVARTFRTTVAGLVFMLLWISEVCFGFIVRDGQSCFWFLLLGWPLLSLTLNIYLSRYAVGHLKNSSENAAHPSTPPLPPPRLQAPCVD